MKVKLDKPKQEREFSVTLSDYEINAIVKSLRASNEWNHEDMANTLNELYIDACG